MAFRAYNSRKHKASRASQQFIARRTYVTHIAAICGNGRIKLIPEYRYNIWIKCPPRKASIEEALKAGFEFVPVRPGTLHHPWNVGGVKTIRCGA